jgi:hypothetical protein
MACTAGTTAFALLLTAALVASLASVPFAARAHKTTGLGGKAFWSLVLAFEGIVSALAIAVGLWCGTRIGLGAPLILHALEGDPAALQALQQGLPVALGVGVATGVVLTALRIALRRWTPTAPPSLVRFRIWERLLAALAAGVREELWFRFGLMTGLAWLAVLALGTSADQPFVLWGLNLLLALGFGAVHLGQARALHGLTPRYVGYILLLNGLASLAFGWLYWRQGLVAAMVAHGSTDLILQGVLAPIESYLRRPRLLQGRSGGTRS